MVFLPFPAAWRPCHMRVGVCSLSKHSWSHLLPKCWPDSSPTSITLELFPQEKPFYTGAPWSLPALCHASLKMQTTERESMTQHLKCLPPNSHDLAVIVHALLSHSVCFQDEQSLRSSFLSSWFKRAKWHSVIWILSTERTWCENRKEMSIVVCRKKEKYIFWDIYLSYFDMHFPVYVFYFGFIAKFQNRSLMLRSESCWLSLMQN